MREMNSAAQKVCSCPRLLRSMYVSRSKCCRKLKKKKNFSRQEWNSGKIITGSLLAKNKIRELVLFADDARFTLSRNGGGVTDDSVTEIPVQFVQFSVHDLKMQ